jgi:CHAT domain-containing protein
MLGEEEQLQFLINNDEVPFFKALTLAYRHADDAKLREMSFGWVLNGKAVSQESLAERALLLRNLEDPKYAAQAKELLGLRADLAGLKLSLPKKGQEEAQQRQIVELTEREKLLSRFLHQATDKTAERSTWIEPADVRSRLTPDSRLIEIALFQPTNPKTGAKPYWLPARYVAWIIPPHGQGEVQFVDLGPAEEIDQLIESVRKSLAGASNSDSLLRREGELAATKKVDEELARVAERVWEPLAPKLGNASKIYLSPDSSLWLLPWAALPASDGRSVLEKYTLEYLISGRDLARAKSAAEKNAATVPTIFADPDFDLSAPAVKTAIQAVLPDIKFDENTTRVVANRSSLPKVSRLPFTALEGQAAASSLKEYVKNEPLNYSARYALESIAKRLHGPRALLFATHGFFLQDQKVKPAETESLSASKVAAKSIQGQKIENPLLSCGLLLTGCNTPQPSLDDGILTGLEIVGLDLRGTELVVLSACETGIGKVRNGEGVAGLRQAFQLAGAESVVSTLWQVPDRDSALIMQDFFANLAAGQSKADALRNAQLKRIEARKEKTGAAHPFIWAAWTITGG